MKTRSIVAQFLSPRSQETGEGPRMVAALPSASFCGVDAVERAGPRQKLAARRRDGGRKAHSTVSCAGGASVAGGQLVIDAVRLEGELLIPG